MSNYDFSLDMETDNSNSLILRNIKEGSKILEVGSAHGRMTKFLKENLHCEVFILETDREAGKIAAQYADRSLLGGSGNVEDVYWYYETETTKFDHIIFADVLEHLHDPEAILKKSLDRLSEDGSIFVSIPNIAHNSVLIDLLQDKFEYRDRGILDKTHLKFFTHKSLRQMIERLGLTVSKEFNAVNVVSNTEFENNYSQLPENIAQYLKSRKYGEVYQFVWELKKSKVDISIITALYGKWNFTKSYLDDMLQLPSNVEIILIDNASPDETETAIQPYLQKYPRIKYVRNPTNEGFGKANGKGIALASGEKILFINNDIKVRNNHHDWIFRLAEKCSDDNIVGPTGGKIDLDNFQFLYETTDPTKSINYMSGWCLMLSRKVIEKLMVDGEFFDPIFHMYHEDTDIGFRSHNLGIKFQLIEIPIVHFGKISSKQLNTYALYKQSKEIFMEKWKHLKGKKEVK